MMKFLENARRQYGGNFELWWRFKERATRDGYSTNNALERLISRYLVHGFDDGEPERKVAR